LPAGYFYARYAATWVLEHRPTVEKNLPVVTDIPDQSDEDQYGAYLYYSILRDISMRMTPYEGLEEKIFDMRISGFNDSYSYLDFYPASQLDGTITAPVLFKNIQRTWAERQVLNSVNVPNSFVDAVPGAIKPEYFFRQARTQYLENPAENVDVVVFGHTHVPSYINLGGGKSYLNSGTWVDDNVDHSATPRTFVVIATDDNNAGAVYSFADDGSIRDITEAVSGDV
jgi:hypothetical protein